MPHTEGIVTQATAGSIRPAIRPVRRALAKSDVGKVDPEVEAQATQHAFGATFAIFD